jgi:membrane protease YdiL (CAAX protease family)
MSIVAATDLPLPPPLPSKRGRPLIAWLVIAVVVVIAAGAEYVVSHWSEKAASRLKEQSEHAYLSELQMQGREIIGFVRGFDQSPALFDQQIKEGLTHGPYEQRLRFIILVGELDGPTKALEQLLAMRDTDWEQHPPTENEAELTALVEKLYRIRQRRCAIRVVGGEVAEAAVMLLADENAPEENGWSLTAGERRELRQKLDWFGDLALTPADGSDPAGRAALLEPAKRTALTLFILPLAVLMAIGVGFMLLAVGILLLITRNLRLRFLTGSRDGGIYAETFALWMVLYLVLEIASAFIPLGSARMLVAGLMGLASLSTLTWPVLRGVSWRRVRQDLGWWTPGPAVVEMLWGLGYYVASMPLVILGVMISSGMLVLYKRLAGDDPFAIPMRPTHPVTEMLVHGTWWQCLQIFFVAAVCAPIIEETMFRGVLYRHLREVGAKWPRALSVLFSALAVSFVFAVIHPQGFLGVPMLMALALGFTMTREVRGSLVGCMTAHGVNNALVTLMVMLSMN